MRASRAAIPICGRKPPGAPNLAGDFRFPGNTALSLTLTRHWIEDLADLVTLIDVGDPLDPNDDEPFDAPGNIGKADAWSLEIAADLAAARAHPRRASDGRRHFLADAKSSIPSPDARVIFPAGRRAN